MIPAVEPLECVAFMLVDGDRLLVEKRSATKKLLPGAMFTECAGTHPRLS